MLIIQPKFESQLAFSPVSASVSPCKNRNHKCARVSVRQKWDDFYKTLLWLLVWGLGRARMNRPISAVGYTTGPLGYFTSTSLFPYLEITTHNSPYYNKGSVQWCTYTYSAWNKAGYTVGAQYMGVYVVGTDLWGWLWAILWAQAGESVWEI